MAGSPIVPRVADPRRENSKLRRFTETVSAILDALLRRGDIQQVGPSDYKISGGSPLTTKGDLFTFGSADARLPVGADGDVLTANSSATLGVDWEVPSSGGGINAWEAAFTKPTIAGLTFVNTIGFTKTDDTNGLFLWNGGLTASDNLCLGHVAVPASGGWSNTARIQALWGDSGFACGGVHLYETGTGKVITFGNQATSGGQRLCVNYFDSVTSFNSEPKTVPCTTRATWLKVTYDGSANYTFWWSMDGLSWVQFGGNFGKTSFFSSAASHAGFFLDPNDSNIVTGIKCLSLVCA